MYIPTLPLAFSNNFFGVDGLVILIIGLLIFGRRLPEAVGNLVLGRRRPAHSSEFSDLFFMVGIALLVAILIYTALRLI